MNSAPLLLKPALCCPFSHPSLLLSLRPVYVSAVRPQSKHLVIMVDHGASVTDTQLQIARDSALVILNAVDEHDKVCLGSNPLTGPVSPSHWSGPLTDPALSLV